MKTRLLGLLAGLFFALPSGAALAQSGCPSIVYGAVLTAGQWNACFAGKQDILGYTPVNKAGDTMQGPLMLTAGTSLAAPFNIPQGFAPASPINGDVWTTTSGMFVRINGATVGPLSTGSSGSFAATSPLSVTFPLSVVTYALNFNSTLGVTSSQLGINLANNNTWTGTNNFTGTFQIGGTTLALPLSLANGGTNNGSLAADNGAVVYSDASKLTLLASTGTAGLCLLSGNHGAPTWGSCTGSAAVASVSNSDGTLTVSPTTGAVVASLNLAHSNTFTAQQIVNLNATAAPTPLSNTILQLTGANANNARFELDVFAGTGLFTCARADGTNASKTALLANDQICSQSAYGYNGSAYVLAASLQTFAAQNWAVGATGTYIRFAVTANAATGQTNQVGIENDGTLTVGASSLGQAMGAGTVRVDTGYFVGASQLQNIFTIGNGLQLVSNAIALNAPVVLANGGTGQTTAAAARASSGLNVDQQTGHGDSAYSILATDRTVNTTATLTANRTWTLPAASAVNPGQSVKINDNVGGVSQSFQLTVARAGSDTIDGAQSVVLAVPYQSVELESDGTSKWKRVSRTAFINQVPITTNNGGIWMADNATYDPVADQWNRIDTSKYALAINIRAFADIPGDPGTQGICMWRATPAANPIGAFTTIGGWELLNCFTNFKDIAMGGFAIELDGNGTLPYARFVNTNFGTVNHKYRGMLTNAFAQATGTDLTSAPSWFVGQFDADTIAIMRAPAAVGSVANTFVTLSTWDSTGNFAATSVRGTAVAFASRPATPVEGMLVAFTDSTTNTWGATITGSGANHVLGYYNGANWTVAGK